jgi:hypothetical protein
MQECDGYYFQVSDLLGAGSICCEDLGLGVYFIPSDSQNHFRTCMRKTLDPDIENGVRGTAYVIKGLLLVFPIHEEDAIDYDNC